MATESITREFYVRDIVAFEQLIRELDRPVNSSKSAADLDILKQSQEKLAKFVFR